ncbi:MAG: radical SAM family heme chaperone HemW [Phycisphaerales bacterium]
MDRTPITIAGQRSTSGHPLESVSATSAGARSLYVHVPFCFHKCHYCDFYSIVDSRDRQEPFTERLMRELEAISPYAGPLASVFVGGGTPTLLRPDLWRWLLSTMHERFDLANAEFTVECNPETASAELFDVLVGGGVNRLSIGAQSFNTNHLETLERWHDPDNVERSVELARAAGIDRQSIDLIFAVPGQTLAEWRSDLDHALGLGASHLSCYALTYEPNTAMTTRLRRGDFEPADEDLEADMLECTLGTLRSAGYERYEVSNYARPGDECRHNLAYWRQDEWLAAGPSASGHFAGWRWKNAPKLEPYLRESADGGRPPVVDAEAPDSARALAERLMTGLRLREGIERQAVLRDAAAIDADLPQQLIAEAESHERRGHLVVDGDRWRLTDTGIMLADGIASAFMMRI